NLGIEETFAAHNTRADKIHFTGQRMIQVELGGELAFIKIDIEFAAINDHCYRTVSGVEKRLCAVQGKACCTHRYHAGCQQLATATITEQDVIASSHSDVTTRCGQSLC